MEFSTVVGPVSRSRAVRAEAHTPGTARGALPHRRAEGEREARPRPQLPTWSFAKVPRLQFSPEENARLLSVYMRPWTLRESESTRYNPLLSLLGKCEKSDDELLPLWLGLPPAAAGSAQDASTPASKRRHIIPEHHTFS